MLKLPRPRELETLRYYGDFPREVELGQRIADLIRGDVVYAFYSRPSHSVKIGRTGDVLKRWAQLENQAGQLRQLLSVWRCPSSRDMECELHGRWAEHRTIGEWFAADPVLDDLRRQSAADLASHRPPR